MARLPDRVAVGDAPKASTINSIIECLQAIWPQPSGYVFPQVREGGTTFDLRFPNPPPQKTQPTTNPNFFIYAASDETGPQIGVTEGFIQLLSAGHVIHVAAADPDTVTDGDSVWIEQTDGLDWEINWDEDWPTDKFYIPLGDITVDGTTVTINYYWTGGDIIAPEMFPVEVSQDGGSEGDDSSTCDFTYTATTLDGVTLDTEMDNDSARIPNIKYTEGTKGFCYFKADGSFGLVVVDETPVTKQQKVITSITFDGTTLKDTYQTLTVFDTDTDDTSETIDTPVACS